MRGCLFHTAYHWWLWPSRGGTYSISTLNPIAISALVEAILSPWFLRNKEPSTTSFQSRLLSAAAFLTRHFLFFFFFLSSELLCVLPRWCSCCSASTLSPCRSCSHVARLCLSYSKIEKGEGEIFHPQWKWPLSMPNAVLPLLTKRFQRKDIMASSDLTAKCRLPQFSFLENCVPKSFYTRI